jgi:hypothetical protein
VVVVLLLGILCLFLDKAFTIDDPLFLWLGRHLQTRPWDFFGFNVNWYGESMPMHAVTMNPPLCGYYIALVTMLTGWTEPALHAAFLVPTGVAVLCQWLLARRLTRSPVFATLAATLTPVFLVSSTNVMCDTLMLAFFLASLLCWHRGLSSDNLAWLYGAAGLASLAFLTKYFAASLIPLLLVHGWATKRRLGTWALPLLLPVIVIVTYDLLGRSLYGHSLLSGAAKYSRSIGDQTKPSALIATCVGLAFVGGSLLHVIFFSFLSWRWVVPLLVLIAFSVGSILVGISAFATELTAPNLTRPQSLVSFQFGLFAFGGASLLALTTADLFRTRTADSLLLGLWVAGTFLFASHLNWVINARSVLPLAPAAGILLARRLDGNGSSPSATLPWMRYVLLIPGAILAVLVAQADAAWSGDVKSAAEKLSASPVSSGARAYFVGHWGFQYYMEARGVTALDANAHELSPGDLVIVPGNNTGIYELSTTVSRRRSEMRLGSDAWIHTVRPEIGAGFYANTLGPVPFAIGVSRRDPYVLMDVTKPCRIQLRKRGS